MKVVIYTDGGCLPNGIGGAGIHGYVYEDTVPKQGAGVKDYYPSAGGYQLKTGDKEAFPEVTIVNYMEGIESLFPKSTNNAAEVSALVNAYDFLLKHPITHACLRIDSKYALQGATEWLAGWKKNNWCKAGGEEVSNVDLWKRIDQQLIELAAKDIEISYKWVKGHSGEPGNDAADSMATKGIMLALKQTQHNNIVFAEAKGYWSQKTEYNRFISQPRWLFTTAENCFLSETGHHVYFMTDMGGSDNDMLIGKPSTETSMSVIYLKEPDLVLQAVREEQRQIPVPFNIGLVLGRMDDILRPRFYAEASKFGCEYTQRLTQRADLYDSKKEQLTMEIRPAGLVFRAVEQFENLQGMLNNFIRRLESDWFAFTEITPHLYEKSVVKSKTTVKLKANIDQSLASITVPVTHKIQGVTHSMDVLLRLGIDIAKRNALSALATDDIQVHVVTWMESDHAFRYATVISSGEDIGIWAGPYSNLALLRTS